MLRGARLPGSRPRARRRLAANAMRVGAVAAGTAAVGALLTGCAASPNGGEAIDAARDFYRAVGDGDGAAGCGMLAPATREALEDEEEAPCAEALLGGDVGLALTATAEAAVGADTQSVTVAGRQAQVVLDDEVTFLVASGSGWLVSATACTPRPERPYDCLVEGA